MNGIVFGRVNKAYEYGGRIVFTGVPYESEDIPEDQHNCDAMGCGSEHVLFWVDKSNIESMRMPPRKRGEPVKRAPLETVDARYADLLRLLGVNGHDGAVAEIKAMRKECRLG